MKAHFNGYLRGRTARARSSFSGEARLASVIDQAQASRRAGQLAEIQYREGSINFLVLLDAQRTLLQAEDDLAQAETAANTGGSPPCLRTTTRERQ